MREGFESFLEGVARYVEVRDRETTLAAMGDSLDRMPGPRSSQIAADLEPLFDAAVRESMG